MGKSTLFNALLKKQQAYAANFPFATIEPNVGVVPVPDERLAKLAQVVKESEKLDTLPPEVPATVEFLDIAGLIAGAHKGEGLGNKFLSHIREVDAIAHVVRYFKDPNILREGSVDPKSDLEVVETELKLADLQTIEKQKDPGNTPDKELRARWAVVEKLKKLLGEGRVARDGEFSEQENKHVRELSLLTSKPILIVLNVDEEDLRDADRIEKEYAASVSVSTDSVIAVCAKTEAELAGFSQEDQKEYMEAIGIRQQGLERVIKKAFKTLGLQTFLTAGEKEVRAWTIRSGMTAPEAAGVIHTDFEKNFIKADVVSFDDFVSCGGWIASREAGKVRSEGGGYVVKDGDVVEFKVGV